MFGNDHDTKNHESCFKVKTYMDEAQVSQLLFMTFSYHSFIYQFKLMITIKLNITINFKQILKQYFKLSMIYPYLLLLASNDSH